jgi:hypothetical protein
MPSILPFLSRRSSFVLLSFSCSPFRYLSDVQFEDVFGKSKDAFYSSPQWAQQRLKKSANLF